ncbi:hypothetical protein L228DRAFT_237621 [Xylona heveae TC161]|uniref:DUF155 domain-containing protein n=1 Tax=Xylona heveae (strain CBS 132557 / TC161) TaxID=1328760 RepID=A0A165ICX8_XYLHT|nr:hypothetical protein L228DRAFT_237621 [Xylona heveae TC161]KZF24721.1 hypothetical protein L228DRAFT_237621 [Xylona heveae TC161]
MTLLHRALGEIIPRPGAILPRRCFSSASQTSLPNAVLQSSLLRPRCLHASSQLCLPRRRGFFSSNALLAQPERSSAQPVQKVDSLDSTTAQRRKTARIPGGKLSSLRRVAVEAQRSREGVLARGAPGVEQYSRKKRVTAYCAAEQFHLPTVVRILKAEGYECDPCGTRLYPQVAHIQIPVDSSISSPLNDNIAVSEQEGDPGDVFVFPSGTVVAWAVPEAVVSFLLTKTLLPAAENPHMDEMETEDLEYIEDHTRVNSNIKGDTIFLGTKPHSLPAPDEILYDADDMEQKAAASLETALAEQEEVLQQRQRVDTTLAKIAFSSGLARSTKLAVLETSLSNYFDSTRLIPTMLSRGSRLPFTRSFILRKTGQLLNVRAQLNLYSELTDSLPDLFWDSRHELGLEGYYDQVGRALDVGVRIKLLNEKMDYAQEIASVLRERLSERHGLVLEWMIIILITVEVGFEILRLYKERLERLERERENALAVVSAAT